MGLKLGTVGGVGDLATWLVGTGTQQGGQGQGHTNLHAGVKGAVHFGFDVDNLPDAEKQEEEKVCGVTGGQQPPRGSH